MDTTTTHNDDRSVGQLIRALSDDSLHLIKAEAQLFRAETESKIAKAQRELIVLGAGAALAYVGVLALSAALILLLALVMDAWVAALLVGVAFVGGGIAAIMIGKKRLAEANLAPSQTLHSVKQDVRTVSEALT